MINLIGTFNVKPSLPENLEPLREIANNLYWTWNSDATDLFLRLDRKLWKKLNHNPVQLLGKVSQERLLEVSKDDGFVSHMNRVYLQMEVYLNEVTWYQKNYETHDKPFIVYFSAEFGLAESLQIYSGGLGVLAGDHLKSSSDLGLPLVGMGLCYREGYFQQYLTSDGWQHERYENNDFYNQPMQLVKDKEGKTLKLKLSFPGRDVYYQIWKIEVGRIPLYLLDTNVAENSIEDRDITKSLYGGDNETRIQQEILLGIGGIRAMHEIGILPLVCHMNEGHSAFLSLERIRHLIKVHGLSFKEAKDIGFFSNIFTTHTPVPAGIDVFPNSLMEKYFGRYYREELGIDDKEFYKLGTIIKERESHEFNMAHLAMNMAGFVNGVSKLHGKVSKKMWVEGFKEIPFDEIPIDYVTNGVHTYSHLSGEMHDLMLRYIGERFDTDVDDKKLWERIEDVPDEELWRTHERRRERLIAFARRRLKEQVKERGGSKSEINIANEVLDPSALTIGFARRFATYKRGNLIFRNLERLAGILFNANRPVQIIIAGKAHPKDEEGKRIIQEIVNYSKGHNLRKRIVFIENYDMNVARYMVEGCDVWLNNPRRPMEASGTSGMKVIANGGLNFSVLDGWWDEAYNQDVGWKIGNGEEYQDIDYQDEIEANVIYDVLEKEIVPLFYDRGSDNLPRGWISMMKNSMRELTPVFNTNRMVKEYFHKFYLNSYERRKLLMQDNWREGKKFSQWKTMIYENWDKITCSGIEFNNGSEHKVGEKNRIVAKVQLGNLTIEDVDVQIYYGKFDEIQDSENNKFASMTPIATSDDNIVTYEGIIECEDTGKFGFTIRVVPKHSLLINPFELGLIKWAIPDKK